MRNLAATQTYVLRYQAMCDPSPEHLVLECSVTADIRECLYPDLVNAIFSVHPNNRILQYVPPHNILIHCILDYISLNLPDDIHISKQLSTRKIFRVSREWCFAMLNVWKWSHNSPGRRPLCMRQKYLPHFTNQTSTAFYYIIMNEFYQSYSVSKL